MEPYLAGLVPSGEGGARSRSPGHREGPSRTQREARCPPAGGSSADSSQRLIETHRLGNRDKTHPGCLRQASLRGSVTPATSHQAGPRASRRPHRSVGRPSTPPGHHSACRPPAVCLGLRLRSVRASHGQTLGWCSLLQGPPWADHPAPSTDALKHEPQVTPLWATALSAHQSQPSG